jgi:hypothetical protein
VSPAAATLGALPNRGRVLAIWTRLAESRLAAGLLFAAVYIGPTVALAREKLLWDDEFFTLYLSKTETWNALLAAMSTGADQHPPSFYYLTHGILQAMGTSHVTLRLPALVGFGIMCLCVYEIVSRLVSRPWGIAAMFLPLTWETYYYASEGRGYGLEVGFVSLALLAWMLAGNGKSRTLTLPLLGVSLCGAVASHYYAGLMLIAFGAGELVRTWMRRKVDPPVWLAFGGALVPLLFFARTIQSARSYSTHFWAVPRWGLMVSWYTTVIGSGVLVLLAAIVLPVIFLMARRWSVSAVYVPPQLWEATALVVLALVPVFGMVVAKSITHAFTERYFIAAIPGLCILVTLGLRLLLGNAPLGAVLVWALCIPGFGVRCYLEHSQHRQAFQETRYGAAILRHSGNASIAIPDVTLFHRLSVYARRDLADRVVYLADPHLSVRYLGHDTVDRGLLQLNPWFPLNVVWFRDWLIAHPSLLVYGSINDWNWVSFELPKWSNEIRLVERDRWRMLLSTQSINIPPDDHTPSDPSGEPMLYRRIPKGAASLCSIYMGGNACPGVDEPNASRPTFEIIRPD